MAAWYRDVVGFKQNCDYSGFKGFTTESGVFFNMVKRGGGDFLQNKETLGYPQGINDTMSIGLSVPTHKDVDIAYNRLIEGGGKALTPPETRDFGHRDAYVADPEGNIICINAVVE
jgi:uncharacterized glyoxalase superfamily protein PhnB